MAEVKQEQLTKKAVNGMVWKFLEKLFGQGMQLVIQIVLARLLMPEEYGLVGLLAIFIAISDVFILQGLTTALIQKKDADDTDFSSVFFANILVAVLLYGVLFAIAPLIAAFYKEPALKNIMRVLSLNVIIGALPAVHNAVLSRELNFKASFFRNAANVITQGGVGITLAVLGWGAWAMVFSKISGMFVGAIVLWLTVKWRPKRTFCFQRVKSLFSFSSKILGTNLLNTIFNNMHSLIIGKAYSPTDVGYYQRGQQIPQVTMGVVDGSMSEVLYPTFSKVQNDKVLLKNAVRRSVSLSMYLVLPVLMGLLVVAEPLTIILLTEKWLPSVPFMQFSCVICMFWPLAHRTHALNAIGKSGTTFCLSLVGKALTLIAIFCCLPFGIYALMIGTIIASAINMWIASYLSKKLIGYQIKELGADVLPPLLLSLIMGAAVYAVSLIPLNVYLQLMIQVALGVTIYLVGSYVFKLSGFTFFLDYAKKFVKKGKNVEKVEEKPMKKIMLLGGSAQQVVAIETAKRLGYYTVLCDYLNDNPGQYVADKFYLVSTTDKEAVLEVAQREKIDGILAYASDPAAPTAAYVAEKLGLPGNPYESVQILCEKDKFRKFLSENGFHTPKAKGYEQISEAVKDLTGGYFTLPVIVKPVDSSGSKGVVRIDESTEVEEKLNYALSYSRGGRIIVEEFVEKFGYQIAGDGLSVDGKLVFRCFANDHFDEKCENPFVPISASFPYNMPKEVQEKVHNEIQRLISLLNMKTCTYNFDMRIDKDYNVYLMEIAPRDGGNYIPQLIQYATGVDLVECSVKAAMGDAIETRSMVEAQGFWSYYAVHSLKNGVLKSILIDEKFEKEHIVENHILKKVGDTVQVFTGANTTLGILLLKFDTMEEMLYAMDNAEKWIQIEVE